jgi:4-amino-4-deoxy-L-arabinose transferase-like glycosyltransferase
MTKKNILKIITAVILGILAIYLSVLHIDSQYMWSDEIFSFNAGKMIIEKGEPLYDSGLHYDRAPLYHNLLALSMKVFGVDEFGSRILNTPFLIGTAVIVGLFIYDLLKRTKLEKEKNLAISYLGGLAYYISNFATAMVRETRMYTFSTFFFLLAVFLFYKGIVNPYEKGKRKIVWYKVDINIYSICAGLLSFYICYATQPINILLGLGIIVFLLVLSILKKSYKYLLLSILITLFGLAYMYKAFDTWNVLSVFKELSPDWATIFTPLYYSILTVRNFPFVLFTAPLTLYFLIKKKDSSIAYLSSIVVSFLVFLSLQSAQHERYWQDVVPLLVVLSVYVIVLFYQKEKNRILRNILTVLVVSSCIFHIYLSIKEYTEIDTYTPHSISIQNKLEFNELFEYLNENLTKEDILICDFHSAYTLYEKGYNIGYLLLPDDDVNLVWGEDDLYFDIPIVKYSDLNSITKENDGYVIVRDYDRFGDIPGTEIEEFTRPEVYKF